MRKLIPAAALSLIAPALASPQSADHPYRGQGYSFFAPDGMNGVAVSMGFGGEALVYRGLGLSAEVGYVGTGWGFRSG